MIGEKKRGLSKYLFFVVLGIFLYVLAFNVQSVFADDIPVYNSSNPLIIVSYHEHPVTVYDYSLTNVFLGSSANIFNLTPLAATEQFNFSTGYLSNGLYNFSISAYDSDGNYDQSYRLFIIEHAGMPVWLIDPLLGIGKTQIYNITVASKNNATCKYSFSNDTNCPIPPAGQEISRLCLFNEYPYFFDNTGSTKHKIVNLLSSRTFTMMYVMCKVAGSPPDDDNATSYGDTMFWTGFQDAPPVIASVNSTPVIDENYRKSLVSVTTDVPTVCTITGGNTLYLNTSEFFDNENMTNFYTYSKNHSVLIDYTLNQAYGFPIDFNYNITCYNYAQWTAIASHTVHYRLNNSIQITRVSPLYVTDQPTTFAIMTNINVQGCGITLNNLGLGEMQRNTAQNYSMSLTLNLGSNQVLVNCSKGCLSGTCIGFASFTVYFDNVAPTLNLSAYPNTCGLDRLVFNFSAADEGSGVNSVYYMIENGSLILNWTRVTSSRQRIVYYPDRSLVENSTYTITAYSKDNAGLISPDATADVLATRYNDATCDFVPPNAFITINSTSDYEASINVRCVDDVGCTDNFMYYFENFSTSCNYSKADTTYSYDELPLNITADIIDGNRTNLCVVVSDENSNQGYASRQIALMKSECGNNVREPSERCDGADLGGATCQSFGFRGGTLRCNACDWDTTNCNAGQGYCGDALVNNFPNEQCDGSNWGSISHSPDSGCKAFGFRSGVLTCNSPFSPQQCMFNTSGCTPFVVSSAQCGGTNPLLDSGEQCEESRGFNLTCNSFDSFRGGDLLCNAGSCMFDISQCINSTGGTLPENYTEPYCGDGIMPSPGKQCEADNITNPAFWKTELGCTDFPVCNQCRIECSGNPTGDACSNGRKDAGETGIDCGGICPACGVSESCIQDSDCISNKCGIDKKCEPDICSNGVKDANETDVDCGGICPKCGSGKDCTINDDCSSNYCISGKCAQNPCDNGVLDSGETDVDCGGVCKQCSVGMKCAADTDCVGGLCKNGACVQQGQGGVGIGLILIIIGIIFIIAGGGYIIYVTYFKKQAAHQQYSQMSSQEMQLKNSEPDVGKEAFLRQDKFGENKSKRLDARKALLKNLDEESGEKDKNSSKEPEEKGEMEKIKEIPAKEEYVDLESLKKEQVGRDVAAKSDAFSRLKNMARNEEEKMDRLSSSDAKDTNAKDSNAKKTESAIEKLKKITPKYTPVELGNKIAKISGISQNKVNTLLNSSTISSKDTVRLFDNLDKSKLTSDIFKEILASLVTSGKISRETVTNLLFENMERGNLTKADVAKILSDLKLL